MNNKSAVNAGIYYCVECQRPYSIKDLQEFAGLMVCRACSVRPERPAITGTVNGLSYSPVDSLFLDRDDPLLELLSFNDKAERRLNGVIFRYWGYDQNLQGFTRMEVVEDVHSSLRYSPLYTFAFENGQCDFFLLKKSK
jgi:hypothetical protein